MLVNTNTVLSNANHKTYKKFTRIN